MKKAKPKLPTYIYDRELVMPLLIERGMIGPVLRMELADHMVAAQRVNREGLDSVGRDEAFLESFSQDAAHLAFCNEMFDDEDT